MAAPKPNEFWQQPGERLDYDIDLTKELDALGDTIASVAWDAEAGVIAENPTNTTKIAKIWVRGVTDGRRYRVTCTVTSAGGRKYERDLYINGRDT